MHVIDSIATQSTCHQAAAAQLLLTCKAVGRDLSTNEGKYELLERAKSVSAVRLAVCETGEGKATVPAACKSILGVPKRLDSELEVVNSKYLAPCLEALMVEHYYWTSYSNSRQQANTLCQAMGLEATRLEALDSYQKLAELLPEFRKDLFSTRSQWLKFLKEQQEQAQDISRLQRHNQDEIKTQHESELRAFRHAIVVAKEGLGDVTRTLQQSMSNADSDIGHTREVSASVTYYRLTSWLTASQALGDVMTDFTKLKDLLNDAFQTASKNNAELTAVQTRDMNSVRDLAIATTEALQHLQSGEVVRVCVNLQNDVAALRLTECQRPGQPNESRTRAYH